MTEYDWIWLNMTEFDWIWLNMTEYDYDWIWLKMTMTEYDWMLLKMTEYDWIWLNKTEYEWIWLPPHSNLPPDQFKGSAQYPTSGQLYLFNLLFHIKSIFKIYPYCCTMCKASWFIIT